MENSGIGSTLREARNRRKLDLSEVEAATKIRARYLRALENEEWEVLPEGVYTRSFIRTYATFLGLDGDQLAERFGRRPPPPPGERGAQRPEPATVPMPGRSALPRGAWVAIGALAVIALLIVVGLTTSGGSSSSRDSVAAHKRHRHHNGGHRGSAQGQRSGVSVRLAATADVWVCLLDASGQPLVDGQILGSGATEGPFHSGSFTVSFGNGEVSMKIDGQQADIPATSSPVGYSIGAGGRLDPLPESQRPTCT